jgi:F-type H+-transporting ATPase subunit epsilon
MAFKCTLVTPETQLFDDSATGAIVPAHDGLVGIETNRAPALLKLGSGPLTIHVAGKPDVVYFIDGGVAQMKDNKLTILTDLAQEPGKLDVEFAKKELADLEKGEAVTTEAARKLRDRRAQRARAMLRMAGVS